MDEYNEYYLFKRRIHREGLLTETSGYKVWFAPGQRKKLLEKIKGEIIAELENLKENHNDIIESFEISNDFKSITYYYKGEIDELFNLEEWDSVKTESKMELFNQIFYSNGDSAFHGNILNFVEVK